MQIKLTCRYFASTYDVPVRIEVLPRKQLTVDAHRRRRRPGAIGRKTTRRRSHRRSLSALLKSGRRYPSRTAGGAHDRF